MLRNGLLSIFVGLSLMAAACGGGSSNQADAGSQDDATGPQFDRVITGDGGGSQDSGPVGNHSFDTAKPVAVDSTTPVADAINPAGDENYYKFDGTAGDWLIIGTIAESLPSDADTVITLFDSNKTQIASDDDAMPWSGTDSEIVIKLPSTGTYYLTVKEYSDWAGLTPKGGPTYKYQVFVGHLRTECTTDTGTNDTVAQAQEMTWFPADTTYPDLRQTLVLGSFSSSTDTDVYSFTVPPLSTDASVLRYVVFEIMPSGADNTDDGNAYGSTSPVGNFTVTNAAGDTILMQINNSDTGAATGIWAPMAPGNYTLQVNHPPTAAGANDFYVVKAYIDFYVMGDLETEGATLTGVNDTMATAQALTVEASTTDPSVNRAFVMTNLATDDTDYFSFTVRSTDTAVGISCSAARSGSGLQGLTVSVRNSSDAEITGGHAVETTSADLSIQDLNPGAGTYYVKLTATGQSAVVTSTFVHCGISMGPAAP